MVFFFCSLIMACPALHTISAAMSLLVLFVINVPSRYGVLLLPCQLGTSTTRNPVSRGKSTEFPSLASMAESNTQNPTVTLSGSTGDTVKIVLRTLLGRDEDSLKVYARSAQRLHRMFPEPRDNERVKMRIGKIQNIDIVLDCLSGADRSPTPPAYWDLFAGNV